MKTKMFAIFAAVMMMAVVGVALVGETGESDADTSAAGTFTVFLYDGTWSHSVVNAYDAAEAVKNSSFWNSNTDSMGERTKLNSYGSLDINEDYGDISKLKGVAETETTVWNVKIYNGSAWVNGDSSLGFYRPFSDYNENFKTANIALYYGNFNFPMMVALNTYSADKLTSITNVGNESTFQMSFFFKCPSSSVYAPVITNPITGVTESSFEDGFYITGYGSDVYLALKNAVGSNVSAYEGIPYTTVSNPWGNSEYTYSWMQNLFGLTDTLVSNNGTPDNYNDDTWAWWSFGFNYNGSSYTSASFAPGWYTPIAGNGSSTISNCSYIFTEVSYA